MAASSSIPRVRRWAWWLLLGALFVHLPIARVALRISRPPHGDFDNYYDIGTKPGRPYVDYQVEFPVATTEAFRVLASMAGTRERFGVDLVVLNVAADVAIAAGLAWGWGVEAAACYALIVIPLVDLFFLRIDLWPTACAALGAAAWRRERPRLAAVALVAGAAFKLWPVMLFPMLLVAPDPRRRRAAIVTAIAAGAAVLTAWFWVAGASGLYQVVTFRGARGWEIESTVGGIWMLFDQRSMRMEAGALRIGTTIGPLSILLFALGAVPCLWMVWRGARTGRLGTGWSGGISALLTMSALLSPQFAVWMAPAGGIAWVERNRRGAVLTGLAIFFTNLVYKSFNPLTHGSPKAIAIVLARNVFLLYLAFESARTLRPPPAA